MMTLTIMTSLIWILGYLGSMSSNPVKISLILVLISGAIFMHMKSSGSVWFPVLYFLIFMGGILMMFMILSSILPNEKDKLKSVPNIMFLALTTLFGLTLAGKSGMSLMVTSNMKSFLQSSESFSILVIMMVLYFFICISMLTEENMSLRSVFCHKESNFVNY